MTYLDEIISGDLVPGRYRLAVPMRVRELRDELAAAGWTTCIVDGAVMHDRASLFDEFTTGCDFPDWFGGNWDAFADCLRDLSWLPDRPIGLLWQHSGALQAVAPRMWDTAGRVIDTAIEDRVATDATQLYVIYPAAAALSDDGGPMLRPVR